MSGRGLILLWPAIEGFRREWRNWQRIALLERRCGVARFRNAGPYGLFGYPHLRHLARGLHGFGRVVASGVRCFVCALDVNGGGLGRVWEGWVVGALWVGNRASQYGILPGVFRVCIIRFGLKRLMIANYFAP